MHFPCKSHIEIKHPMVFLIENGVENNGEWAWGLEKGAYGRGMHVGGESPEVNGVDGTAFCIGR